MIGQLKHRVTVQESVRVPDSGGGFTHVWQAIGMAPNIYAAIMPLSGREILRFHQLETAVTHRITVRYRDDIRPAMRMLKGDIVYDIGTVTDKDGLGVYLEILAILRSPE